MWHNLGSGFKAWNPFFWLTENEMWPGLCWHFPEQSQQKCRCCLNRGGTIPIFLAASEALLELQTSQRKWVGWSESCRVSAVSDADPDNAGSYSDISLNLELGMWKYLIGFVIVWSEMGWRRLAWSVRYKYGSFWANAQVLFGLAVSADCVVWDGVNVHFKQRPSESAYCHCAEKSHANLSAHR